MRALAFIAFLMAAGVAHAQPTTPLCAWPNDNGCLGLAGLQRVTAYGVGANGTVAVVPANAVLRAVYVRNTTANAVTGGINIGTTSGGSDVASAVAVGASGLVVIDGSTLAKKYFNATTNTLLFVSTVTAWNSAALDIRFQFDQ